MSLEQNGESLLLSLPLDVLYQILCFCDNTSLGRLSTVCKRLNEIVRQDYVWITRSKNAIVTNQISKLIQIRSCCHLSARDKCRVSSNWRKGYYENEELLVHRTPYMPWLQLSSRRLLYSKGNVILCFARRPHGGISKTPLFVLRGHMDDISRFVQRDGFIVSGGRDGTICGWEENSGRFMFCKRRCHSSDVNSVDFRENVIVSGSKDKTVNVWTLQNGLADCQYTLVVNDRVWSVAITPCRRTLISGSAGHQGIPPLQMFDLETSTKICNLGTSHRNGAGVLHIYPESSHELLSCGYDTYVRMWDTRAGPQCVQEWEDPYDSAVYCVASDGHYSFVSGTSRHGLVRLWDKRYVSPVQMFYVSRGNSPVYSVTFDPCYMYVAVDRTLNLLKFTNPRNYSCSTIER